MAIRIVVADDHPVVRDGLRYLETDEPDIRVVAEAGSGDELIGVLSEGAADVVVLDINMPDRDGLGVLPDLRAMFLALPVLVLSMFPEEQYALRVLRSGAAGYVSKRHAAEQLATAIRIVSRGDRYLSPTVAERLADVMVNKQPESRHERLSEREFAVIRLLGGGRTVSEIAELLALNRKTVSTYRARVLDKLDLRNNADIARYAVQHQLLE